MRLVTYNIQYGRGKDDRVDLERIARAVAGADVIALQEVERYWPHSGMVDQAAELSVLLPAHYWVYGAIFDLDASLEDENGGIQNRRRQFGPMLMSRLPIVWSRTHLFPKLATDSHFHMDTGAVEGLIETKGGPLRCYSLHLSHLNSRERLLQLDFLLAQHRRALVNGPPWGGPPVTGGETGWDAGARAPQTTSEACLLGDFNSETGSPEYELLVGPKDATGARVHHVDGFVDTWAAAHREEDGEVTWIRPPYYQDLPDRRLDYCFVSPSLASHVTNAWVDTDAQGSDHQPYWVELDI